MSPPTVHDRVRSMKLLLLTCSLSTLTLLGFAAWEENFGGHWRSLQREYRELLVEQASSEKDRQAAAAFEIRHRQIFLPELDTIDRCVTCHLGVEVSSMADAPQPFRSHPGELLVQHAPERFGCTVCHGGQGRATTQREAHGWTADGEPLPYAQERLLRGEAVQTSCGRCHAEVDLYGGQADLYAGSFGAGPDEPTKPQIDRSALSLSLPGTELIAEGKRLVIESGCLGCHRYRGGGGDVGPDLTYVGDEGVHHFDFSAVQGEHTVEQWHLEHFLQPSVVSPETMMPEMGFTASEARVLALYMMSLHRKDAPASHIPRPRAQVPEVAGRVTGETLFSMFCAACHGREGRGDGPAAATIEGQPRDFWHERFRYVSTLEGGPTEDDLERTIRTGRGFEAMPRDPQLTAAEVRLLADYVRSLARAGLEQRLTEAFADDDDLTPDDIAEIAAERILPGEPIEVPQPGPDFVVDAARGLALFTDNCASCHGTEGRGDGSEELFDELGRPMHARDLTAGVFRGGAEADEIFKRIRVGLPGTPMPAQDELTDEEVWQLVRQVFSFAGLDAQDEP